MVLAIIHASAYTRYYVEREYISVSRYWLSLTGHLVQYYKVTLVEYWFRCGILVSPLILVQSCHPTNKEDPYNYICYGRSVLLHSASEDLRLLATLAHPTRRRRSSRSLLVSIRHCLAHCLAKTPTDKQQSHQHPRRKIQPLHLVHSRNLGLRQNSPPPPSRVLQPASASVLHSECRDQIHRGIPQGRKRYQGRCLPWPWLSLSHA